MGPREVKSISGGYIQPLALTDLATRLLRSDETVYGRELARLTGISPGTLHRELQALTEMGLLTRLAVKSVDSSFILQIKAFPCSRTWPRLCARQQLLRAALMPLHDHTRCAFLYGSMASGETKC